MPAGSVSARMVFQSTHPARGATLFQNGIEKGIDIFQSTHPARGATLRIGDVLSLKTISIHAPREGCDCVRKTRTSMGAISIHAPREGCDMRTRAIQNEQCYFNPRTPRGVRPAPGLRRPGILNLFQSTHPARGATSVIAMSRHSVMISIHAPREGCDRGEQRSGRSL